MELAKQLAAGTGAQDPTSLMSQANIDHQKKITAEQEAKAHETAQKILQEHLLKQKMAMKHPFSSVHQIAGSLANKVDDWKNEKQQQLAKTA